MGRPLGMRFDEVDHGHVVTSIQTRPDFSNPLGTVHGGITDTLPDSVVGCAVHTSLPAGVGYTTLKVKVIYVRAVQTNGETLTAAAPSSAPGRRAATAEARSSTDAASSSPTPPRPSTAPAENGCGWNGRAHRRTRDPRRRTSCFTSTTASSSAAERSLRKASRRP